MISVEHIYQSLKDLSTKGKGGYTDSVEFNRNSQRAELLLWQYYFSIYEAGRRVPEAMAPFIKVDTLQLTAGAFTLPASWGHTLNVHHISTLSGVECGDAPVQTGKLARYLQKHELHMTLESPIRGKGTFYSFTEDRKVQMYPETLTGQAKIEYLRYPTFAVRAFTLDVPNQEQNPDSVNSVDYEWQPQDENNLIDILLLFHGLINRDTHLMQWAQTHQSITQMQVK